MSQIPGYKPKNLAAFENLNKEQLIKLIENLRKENQTLRNSLKILSNPWNKFKNLMKNL